MFNADTETGSFLEKIRVAECGLGITQRLGTLLARNIDGYLNDVWIGSTIRETCPECYADTYNKYCKSTAGYQMQTATEGV